MRYEFERGRHHRRQRAVGGPRPGQVEAADPSTRAAVDRYLSSEVTYLGGFGGGRTLQQPRRRDWTPWEFERACRNLAHRLRRHREAGRDRPGRRSRAGGGRADEGHRRARRCSSPSRARASTSSSASPAARSCPPTTRCSTRASATCSAGTSRAPGTPPRATRGRPARSASRWRRPAPAAATWSRRSPTRRWTRSRWSRSPARSRRRSSATTPSRRPTSPASRCRSRSTTSS